MAGRRGMELPSPSRVTAAGLAGSAAPLDPQQFRSFYSAAVDDRSFPPTIGPKELRLPRLPAHREGPAPVVFGATSTYATASAAAEMDNMWMVGFLDAQGGALASNKSPLKGKLPGYGTSAAAKRALFRKKYNVAAGGRAPASGEQVDVLAASSEFKRLMARLSELHYEDDRKRMTVDAAARHRLAHNPLMHENKRIRAALLGGRAGRGSSSGGGAGMLGMRASGLDRLLLLERLEVQAAIVCQRWWRRELRKRFWRRFALENRICTQVQGLWRGHVERRRIMRYFRACKRVARYCAAWFRGAAVRAAVRAEAEWVDDAATDIQRVFRGHSARARVRAMLHSERAVRLQAWWRGCLGRGLADRRWFHRVVTRITSHFRRHTAQRRVGATRRQFYAAATAIQAAVKGWMARRVRDVALWEAETNNRRRVMLLMKAHAGWLEGAMEDLVKDVRLSGVEEEAARLESEWQGQCGEVPELEREFLSQRREFAGVPPPDPNDSSAVAVRAQADRDLRGARAAVSEAKATALFRTALPLRTLQARLVGQVESLDAMALRVARCNERIAIDRADSFRRELKMKRAREKRVLARRAAEERRRWAVVPHTDTGKPDLKKVALLGLIKAKQAAAAGRRGGGLLLQDKLAAAAGVAAASVTAEGVGSAYGSLAAGDILSLAGVFSSAADDPAFLARMAQSQAAAAAALDLRSRTFMTDFDRRFGNRFGGGGAASVAEGAAAAGDGGGDTYDAAAPVDARRSGQQPLYQQHAAALGVGAQGLQAAPAGFGWGLPPPAAPALPDPFAPTAEHQRSRRVPRGSGASQSAGRGSGGRRRQQQPQPGRGGMLLLEDAPAEPSAVTRAYNVAEVLGGLIDYDKLARPPSNPAVSSTALELQDESVEATGGYRVPDTVSFGAVRAGPMMAVRQRTLRQTARPSRQGAERGRFGGTGHDGAAIEAGVNMRGRAAQHVEDARDQHAAAAVAAAAGGAADGEEEAAADAPPANATAAEYAAWMLRQAEEAEELQPLGPPKEDQAARRQRSSVSFAAQAGVSATGSTELDTEAAGSPGAGGFQVGVSSSSLAAPSSSAVAAWGTDASLVSGSAVGGDSGGGSQAGGGGGSGGSGGGGYRAYKDECDAAAAEDVAEDAALGSRVSRLLTVVSTLNAQAETLQYGALLRPLMEGAGRVMANAMAADGTAGAVALAASGREARDSRVQARLAEARRMRLEAKDAARNAAAAAGADNPPSRQPLGDADQPFAVPGLQGEEEEEAEEEGVGGTATAAPFKLPRLPSAKGAASRPGSRSSTAFAAPASARAGSSAVLRVNVRPGSLAGAEDEDDEEEEEQRPDLWSHQATEADRASTRSVGSFADNFDGRNGTSSRGQRQQRQPSAEAATASGTRLPPLVQQQQQQAGVESHGSAHARFWNVYSRHQAEKARGARDFDASLRAAADAEERAAARVAARVAREEELARVLRGKKEAREAQQLDDMLSTFGVSPPASRGAGRLPSGGGEGGMVMGFDLSSTGEGGVLEPTLMPAPGAAASTGNGRAAAGGRRGVGGGGGGGIPWHLLEELDRDRSAFASPGGGGSQV